MYCETSLAGSRGPPKIEILVEIFLDWGNNTTHDCYLWLIICSKKLWSTDMKVRYLDTWKIRITQVFSFLDSDRSLLQRFEQGRTNAKLDNMFSSLCREFIVVESGGERDAQEESVSANNGNITRHKLSCSSAFFVVQTELGNKEVVRDYATGVNESKSPGVHDGADSINRGATTRHCTGGYIMKISCGECLDAEMSTLHVQVISVERSPQGIDDERSAMTVPERMSNGRGFPDSGIT